MLKVVLAAVLSSAALAACATGGTADGSERIVYVAAETAPCQGVAPMTCLQVRDRPQDAWTLHYFGIEGFQHRPGTEYRLRIRVIPVENPPADAPSQRWSLIEILDQRYG